MDTKVVADGYILWDTKLDKPYSLRVFGRTGDAANSYNAEKNYIDGVWAPATPTWKNQSRFQTRPVRIIDAVTGDYLT